MKTIHATIPCSQQLLTSPAWGRIFEGLKRRYLTDLWLHTPLHIEERIDNEGSKWLKQNIVYTIIREDKTMHIKIVGPWLCIDPKRYQTGFHREWLA